MAHNKVARSRAATLRRTWQAVLGGRSARDRAVVLWCFQATHKLRSDAVKPSDARAVVVNMVSNAPFVDVLRVL